MSFNRYLPGYEHNINIHLSSLHDLEGRHERYCDVFALNVHFSKPKRNPCHCDCGRCRSITAARGKSNNFKRVWDHLICHSSQFQPTVNFNHGIDK